MVVDPEPEKILPADAGDIHDLVRQRTYYGGYIVSMPAQDVRRMLPMIHVLGTGWRHNPLVARRLLANWLLADCEQVAQRAEWWCDMEINPDREFESYIENRTLTGPEEYAFGLRRTRELFDEGGGLPAFVQPPAFDRPAAAAILPDDNAADRGAILAKPLPTLRGLGPLLTQESPPKASRKSLARVSRTGDRHRDRCGNRHRDRSHMMAQTGPPGWQTPDLR